MKWVRLFSYAAFVYAILGYYNQYYLGWIQSMWVSGYSLAIVIVIFGVWRTPLTGNKEIDVGTWRRQPLGEWARWP